MPSKWYFTQTTSELRFWHYCLSTATKLSKRLYSFNIVLDNDKKFLGVFGSYIKLKNSLQFNWILHNVSVTFRKQDKIYIVLNEHYMSKLIVSTCLRVFQCAVERNVINWIKEDSSYDYHYSRRSYCWKVTKVFHYLE